MRPRNSPYLPLSGGVLRWAQAATGVVIPAADTAGALGRCRNLRPGPKAEHYLPHPTRQSLVPQLSYSTDVISA